MGLRRSAAVGLTASKRGILSCALWPLRNSWPGRHPGPACQSGKIDPRGKMLHENNVKNKCVNV
jgi:hypothetical protein